MPRPVSLVIFDCDGVLIDSEVISSRVLIEEAARDGLMLTADYVRRHFLGRSFPTVAATIREQLNVALPEDFEARYRTSLLARFETDLRVTPGLGPLLEVLRVPFCLATSSSPPRLARSLEITGLDGVFTRCFTASEVEHGKPAPDLFLHAAVQMGVDPAECLVIEDTRPGVLAAHAAGMQVALYTGGSHMAGVDPASIIGDLSGVIELPGWAAFPDIWPRLCMEPRT